jgi:hypothetical protein
MIETIILAVENVIVLGNVLSPRATKVPEGYRFLPVRMYVRMYVCTYVCTYDLV